MYNRCTSEIGIQSLNNRYIIVLNLREGPKQYRFFSLNDICLLTEKYVY